MPLFDRLKGEADRMQFEANKMMRINAIQNDINGLKGQLQAKRDELSLAVYEMFKAQQLSDPKLNSLCQALQTLDTAITSKEKDIENIKLERAQAPAQPAAPAPRVPNPAPATATFAPATAPVSGAVYGHICPKENIPLPENVMFCPNCGSKAIDVPASAPAAAATPSVCPNCQTPLTGNVAFCPNCGTRLSPA